MSRFKLKTTDFKIRFMFLLYTTDFANNCFFVRDKVIFFVKNLFFCFKLCQ